MSDEDTHTDITARLRRTDENRGVPICSHAADEIEKLRKERDEARREVCELKSYNFESKITPKAYAELRKWDCFKEEFFVGDDDHAKEGL